MMDRQAILPWIPVLFVLLWSTGFIGSKYGLPYAEPFTFLSIRMYFTLAAFLLLIRIYRAPWPGMAGAMHSMIVGLLVQSAYLGGVFSAIDGGMTAGLTALLVGLQPILTAVLAWGVLGERVSHRQKAGLTLGLVGVSLVLVLGMSSQETISYTPRTIGYALLALLGITLGTLYQKRFCGNIGLLTGAFYQFLITAVVMSLLALQFESREVDWTPAFAFTLCWLVFGLSVGAILLLMRMIREGEAARVASYFYLTPPVTALIAWFLFEERLTFWAIGGILLTAAGVYLVVKPARQAVQRA